MSLGVKVWKDSISYIKSSHDALGEIPEVVVKECNQSDIQQFSFLHVFCGQTDWPQGPVLSPVFLRVPEKDRR
jgi:hypothetical protein